ncbi:MAG: hypothetical protein ACREHG_00065 [Candidatus Saccharimonadales bacterium]
MSAQLKENADGSLGVEGLKKGDASSGIININIEYNASSVDKSSFIATRQYRVKAITGRVTAAGTDASAVTAAVKKVASGTAIASGTALHSGTMNLKGTANTNQILTVTSTASLIDVGDAIGADFTGTLTAATGVITVTLTPA